MHDPTEPKNNEEPKLATELFTEEEYERAWNNAGPLARERFVKKSLKRKWRSPRWIPSATRPPSNTSETVSPFKTKGHVELQYLPPKDLVDYTVAFVTYFKDKGAANG